MGDSVLSQWRAIEGTLINFSGTQILRRRRRKVFFPSLLWKRSYRPTESTLISAPLSIKTFVFSVPVKKRRRTTSRLTCVRGKKEGRRLFFSSWAFCDCGILEIFCCSYCLAVIQKLAKNLIFTGVGIFTSAKLQHMPPKAVVISGNWGLRREEAAAVVVLEEKCV